jgi:hypothetical protein
VQNWPSVTLNAVCIYINHCALKMITILYFTRRTFTNILKYPQKARKRATCWNGQRYFNLGITRSGQLHVLAAVPPTNDRMVHTAHKRE